MCRHHARRLRHSICATSLVGVLCSAAGADERVSSPAIPVRSARIVVLDPEQLGEIDRGWWRARYTAAFTEPDATGYLELGPLLLFSYDLVQPGGVFALHAHENIEVLTVVLEGSFEHVDTAGHSGRAETGDVMLMSAGRGVQHAERADPDGPTRVATIWIEPRTRNAAPRHVIRPIGRASDWQLIAAERDAPLIVDQDARVSMKRMAQGESAWLNAPAGRTLYLGVIEGEVALNGRRLATPGRIIIHEGALEIASDDRATMLLIDVPHA